MLFSVTFFILGIVVVQQLSVLPETIWLIGLVFLVLVLVFFRYWRLMFFVIGILWAIVFSSIRLADRLPEYLEGRNLLVEGYIVGIPKYDRHRIRFDFAVLKSDHPLPNRIRLNWYSSKQKIKSGQFWRLTVKLKQSRGRLNLGGFDYERWLFMQNIGATGYVKQFPEPVKLADSSFKQSIDVIRQSISDKLDLLLKNSEYIGVVKALMIGERFEISDQQWEVFRKTGVVHLLAISGLHIGFISGISYFLTLKILTYFLISSPQKIAAIFAVLVALFYSALAGFSLPTQRSVLMLWVVMSAVIWQRHITVRHILAVAALVVVIIDPLAVLSAGFWLSFLAVGLIVYFLGARLGGSKSWVKAFKIHWVTALGLSPLLVLYFQQFSIVAPLANLVAVPVISLWVVPLCFLCVITMGIYPNLSVNILLLIEQTLQVLWSILAVMAELPYAAITIVKPPFYMIVLALIGSLLLLAPKGIPSRWLGLVLWSSMFFIRQEKLKQGELEITLLDVGQGLSTVIETKNHTLVFDTGAKFSEKYDMGKSVVIPFLKEKRINKVDLLIISHADNDHIGGAESIINDIRVNSIMSSEPGLLKEFGSTKCISGTNWEWDQVKFEILSPEMSIFTGDNNNSCVVKVWTEQGGILLTGDIESLAERWLVTNMPNKLASDILISPHHGSKTSSSMVFLSQVKPSIVLISSGYKNRFSFPHQEVLTRYDEIHAKWFNTAVEGALTIKLGSICDVVHSFRIEQGKYWNQ